MASTLAQYAVLGSLAGGAVLYYKPQIIRDLLAKLSPEQIPAPLQAEVVNNKKKSKKSTQNGNAKASGTEASSSKSKKRKISAPVSESVTVTRTDGKETEISRDDNDDMDARAFAKSLAKAQAGTDLQSQSKQKNGTKANRLYAATQSEVTSEVNGDQEKSSSRAEDSSVDEESIASPSGRDISDMLEAPARAPKSLRITNVPEQKKAEQKSKKVDEVLTKKQRQRQAKREEEKRLAAEADKIHDQKKQQQLRSARTAAGTSNQIKANNFNTSTPTAWQNPVQAPQTNGVRSAPLLDTFEAQSTTHEAVQTKDISSITGTDNNTASALKSEVGTGAAEAIGASQRENGVAPEEEDVTWEAVQSKKTKKKNRKDSDTNTSSDRSRSVSAAAPQRAVQKSNGFIHGTSKPPTKADGVSKQTAPINRYASLQPGTQTQTSILANDEWAA